MLGGAETDADTVRRAQSARPTTAALPLITIVLPVFNESALLRPNVAEIHQHLKTLECRYRFEMLIVDDGSTDGSGHIADDLAKDFPIVRVIHHPRNFGVGQGLRTGFAHARGDYVVVLDVDLSYGPHHVERMLDRMIETSAKLVVASPYGPGGTVANVPRWRLLLSRSANRFLSMFAPGNYSTWTCMVRAFDGRFLRGLHLRGARVNLMPEIMHKVLVLQGRIEEVPAELDWARQNAVAGQRRSSLRLVKQVLGTILSGFMLRPFVFLMLPGLVVLLFALYSSYWMFIHYFEAYGELLRTQAIVHLAEPLRIAYQVHPHTYVFALLSLVLAIQLIGLGMLAYQAKYNHDNLFHLGSTMYRWMAESRQAPATTADTAGDSSNRESRDANGF
jgi:glycosyltransferase involved in cell wall biosynthesis